MRRLCLLATLLCAVAVPDARAEDPDLEARITAQDALAERKEDVRLLNEAKAAVRENETPASRYLLGRAYGLINELEKAREQFDWALERDPAFAYAYHGLGIYYVLKGNLEEADRNLRTALRLDPELARARLELAKLFLMKEDLTSAEQELTRILDRRPQDVEVRALLGHCFLRRKDYDKAIQEFRGVLTRNPRHANSQKALALALAFARRTDEAIAEFRKMTTLDPADLEVWVFLKNLLLEKGDVAGAIEALEKLAAAVPADSPYAREALAEKERLARGEPDGGGLTFAGLLAKLDSKEAAVRRDAMQAIVGLNLPKLPGRVVLAVRDEDEVVRVLAVSELGRAGGVEAVGILEILLLHPADRDKSERVRGAGARALASLRTPAAVPVLVAALDDESHYVFGLVSEALSGYTGLSFTEDPAQPVPPDRRDEVRARWRAWWASPRSFGAKCEALAAFESLRLSRLMLYVAALLSDQDPAVAGRARATFFALTGEQIGTDADLLSPEGRSRLRTLAEAVLEKRRSAGRK